MLETDREEMLRRQYERCHPGDTLEALKSRARFSKEDRRLLEDWRDAILYRARAYRGDEHGDAVR